MTLLQSVDLKTCVWHNRKTLLEIEITRANPPTSQEKASYTEDTHDEESTDPVYNPNTTSSIQRPTSTVKTICHQAAPILLWMQKVLC